MVANTVQIFAFLLTITSALALTCYKCDSSQSSLCNYGLGRFTYDTVNCDEEAKGGFLTNWVPKECIKLTAKDDKGNEYVARGCGPGIGSTACSAIAKTAGFFSGLEGGAHDFNCYTCDTDKCNSASKYAAYSMLGIMLAAMAFLF